jgi:hypothetical protein
MTLIEKFIVALFVVFLHYVGLIGVRAVRTSRYHLSWSRMDATAIVLGMVVLAIGIVAIDLLVFWSNSPLLRQAFNHLFLLALVSGWLVSLALGLLRARPNVVQCIWLIAAAVVGFSFGRSEASLVHYAAYGCLFLSPIILPVTAVMFSWERWSSKRDRMPAPSHQASHGTPVFFFFFDEWSFPRSTARGEFHPELKNLRKLCAQSVFFPHATSPHNETAQSLPAILFQTDKKYATDIPEPHFQGPEGSVSLRTMNNLFGMSKKHNYFSYLLGWFHPYRQLLGAQVDYCHVYSEKPLSTKGLLGKIACNILGIAAYLTDPISRGLWPRVEKAFVSRQWFEMGNHYRKEMLRLLADSPPRSFAFFHAPWPHAPFVFTANGCYSGATLDNTNTNDYLRQIAYVDHLIGEIVGTLQAAGKFDEALLIITSDHGWRFDPDQVVRALPKFDRSVPLLIKLPGQCSAHVIRQEFCNNQLAPLVEAVLSGNNNTEELVQLLIAQPGGVSRACA